ncbi:hypothetical protein EDD99_5572 [Streptomyces sp. 846.5]|nr:hypothetical protein EDD99_5572 [Streptomyces sp. 846.5]
MTRACRTRSPYCESVNDDQADDERDAAVERMRRDPGVQVSIVLAETLNAWARTDASGAGGRGHRPQRPVHFGCRHPPRGATEPEVRLTRNRPARHVKINLSFAALAQAVTLLRHRPSPVSTGQGSAVPGARGAPVGAGSPAADAYYGAGPNSEAELLQLLGEVLELAKRGPVTWAVDLNAGGAALWIALLVAHGQKLFYIPGRKSRPRPGRLPSSPTARSATAP